MCRLNIKIKLNVVAMKRGTDNLPPFFFRAEGLAFCRRWVSAYEYSACSRGMRSTIFLSRKKNGSPKRKAVWDFTAQHRFPARGTTIAGYPTCWRRRYETGDMQAIRERLDCLIRFLHGSYILPEFLSKVNTRISGIVYCVWWLIWFIVE